MTDTVDRPAIGVVGIRDAWSSERLADAVAARTGRRLIVDMRRVAADVVAGRVELDGEDLTRLDALIVKKIGRTYRPALLDRLELLEYLEGRGVRIFSRPRSMMRLLNRLSCTVTLRRHGIPMPPTVITESLDEAVAAVERFGRAVLKPLYTSKARGMVVVETGPEARDRVADFQEDGNAMLYVQQAVRLPERDLGVVFLGGEYVATYARQARRLDNNPHAGVRTRYWACEPPAEIIDLARRAQAPFELDFTGVDVVETADGPLVFEVSAFGGFRGLYEGCGLDAAGLYVDHVLRTLASVR